ncbi:MAG TPA: thioredoxin peroxidase [Elusimicrobia bacterium]|nr:MAG: thioredoxin peroxidase [Elusimicrobia bacterium GWA2_66_18]OGR72520.1 MAG: thioredoxin peroxidase [Elusimicrobia bacterium GWC2_65_9]HAZ08771.1 thioredoxin peroxidase [Elusimicrobiota bacterium]
MTDTLVQKDAPDFKAEALVGKGFKEISLSDYKGKWVALFFYPLDFTFVCPTEIVAFSERYEDFKKLGCEVLGCSVDSKFTHLAWTNTARKEGGLGAIKYPLLSDLTKKIARDYGVLVNDALALRGLFLINAKGKVVYAVVHDLGVGRSVDETLRVLAAFQQTEKTGEVCPANWSEGKKTMKPDPAKSKEYFATVA